MRSILTALILMMGSTAAYSTANDQQMFRALIDDKACYATVFSGSEILLPSHCVSSPYDTVSLENIGPKKIESVRDFAEDERSELFQLSEHILIVRFAENI